ncbi:receptor kinase-like protein Xa21 [Gossypium arboreum]|uniref:receptor kinase-like protein Xa21 n=1 Tax=Gossypium arboreum TaxID=29729 RepID=UPI00081944B9|nr:receptor kinase-like protein Xa21 [Gossypium arboreum]
MSNLENLDLRNNLVHGNIPYEMSKLMKLRTLRLAKNQLSGSIPAAIYNISALRMISLPYNNLSGSLPKKICHHLLNLEALYLYENEFSGQIPTSIGECKNLRQLILDTNRFNGRIPTSIGNLTALTDLYLFANDLEGEIPWEIGKLEKLEYLHVEYMRLDGSIPASIFNLSSLKTIVLGDNNLSGELPYITSVRNLEKIFLWGNHLSGNILDSISNITKLKILELQRNSFSGLIPNALGNLQFLERLTLRSNHLTTKTSSNGWSFLDSLTKCRYLIHLDLSLNPLGGVLPPSISNLSISLLQFEATACKIRGNIPMEIGSLNNALTLDLSVNELSGSIPTTIGRLKNIQLLDFSGNKLQGSIPHQLCGLKGLYKLSFATNELDGPLPVGLGNLIALRKLNFSSNKLHSSIPLSFWRLKDILEVDLSSNYFSGSLSLDIGNLEVITHLDLSRNFLSSDIPSTFGSLHYLQVLLLSHNRLQGPIPESLGDMISLRKNKSTGLTIVEDLVHVRQWRRISYYQLWEGTDGFNERNLLGSGSFGSIYKGMLSCGTEVAIKVFNLEIEGAFKSFDVECEVMAEILHRNLVKIITCCSTIDFKALVLEFMPNGSLEKWLHSDDHALDILQRINIMVDVALALEYLYSRFLIPIIHCDLKPSNVLLDEDMVGHVGDFGVSKLLGEGDSIKQTMTLATVGYMAPEYGSAGIVSVKCDVYSYGILLMETFTRKKPTNEFFVGEMSMKHWVKMSLSNGINGVGDSSIVQEEDEYFVVKANYTMSQHPSDSDRFVQPVIPRFDDAQKMEIDAQKLKDLRAKNYLFQAIDRSILEMILCKDTTKHIWDSMKKKYQGNARAKRALLQTLRGEFENLHMKPGETISDYFSKIMTIVNRMRTHGEKLGDVAESEEQALQALSIHKDSGHGKNKWRGRSSDERRNFWDHRIPHGKPKAIDKSQIECYSNHMCGDRSAFSELDETLRTTVKFGDNSLVFVQGRGKVKIQTKFSSV